MTLHPNVQAFFDPVTFTVTYVVWDADSRDAIVIDPVLDYDPAASRTSDANLKPLLSFLNEHSLKLRGALDTHAHADHISGSVYLRAELGVPIVIGAGIRSSQATFRKILGLPESVLCDGFQFEKLAAPGEVLSLGALKVQGLDTKGHTPGCVSYWVGDAVFTGDALFMEDYGTGRTEFPGGSAEVLYHSVTQVLYSLPEATRVFVGHDCGRDLKYETTIASQKRSNVQIREGVSLEEFVQFRTERDRSLAAPRLLFPSVQINVFGGQLPAPESNGTRYLKVPINLNAKTDESGRPA